MVEVKDRRREELPFRGKKVYFSMAISGPGDNFGDFGWELANYIKDGGAEVLDEWVATRTREENALVFLEKTGVDRRVVHNPWFFVRRKDLEMVNAASHLIAVVDHPSHGVGMEIQRAIDKKQMGLGETKVLCLVHRTHLDKLTWMIKGIIPKVESPGFELAAYEDIRDAKRFIYQFLTS